MDPSQIRHGSTGMGGAGRTDAREGQADGMYSDARMRDSRQAEQTIRTGIAEIEEAIDRLDRTCRQGRITRSELAETRSVLEIQRQRLAGID
jgi:hypothetical protein